ncbi:uncharacterized protein TRIADDRAFT_24481, partial [Trichoplax adhaerens]
LTSRMRAFSLRPLLIIHNFFCSAVSVYTALSSFYGAYQGGSAFLTKPVENLRYGFYLYWISKNVELLDTLYIILKKKYRQLSFLHVYHHSSMVLFSEFGYRLCPYPAIAIPLGINSVIHVFLYYYYGMCALDPANPPTWKKRLTEMQILQFIIGVTHSTLGYLYHGFCFYGVIYGFSMLWLFCNFYYKAYLTKRRLKNE